MLLNLTVGIVFLSKVFGLLIYNGSPENWGKHSVLFEPVSPAEAMWPRDKVSKINHLHEKLILYKILSYTLKYTA